MDSVVFPIDEETPQNPSVKRLGSSTVSLKNTTESRYPRKEDAMPFCMLSERSDHVRIENRSR